MGYIGDKVLGSNEGIKLVFFDVKMFGDLLGSSGGITLGVDV